jgi:hypothetical protein
MTLSSLPSSSLSPEVYAALLRRDPFAFIHRAFRELNPQTPFLPAPYIELMASRLEDCRQGRIRRLIINLPPRSLKSHCVSIAFVAWLLGHNPAIQIIAASYGQDLADKFARDTWTLMESAWFQALFATRLSSRRAVSDFTTTAGGTRMATSIGGVLTGRGADIILIDDPLKPGALGGREKGGQRLVRQYAAFASQQQEDGLHHHRDAAPTSGRSRRPRW